MKYPGLAKSAQMYGGIGLTGFLKHDNDSNSGLGHWHNWQAVQTLTVSVSLVNSHRLLICCASQGLKNSEISKHVHIGLQKNLDFINVRLD